jgi:hypothetical protein
MDKDEKPSKCLYYSAGPPEQCGKFSGECYVLGLVSNCPELQPNPQQEQV